MTGRPKSEPDSRSIAIFDSGVGGLTVFREIARALPQESLIYLGDSARLPYGTKSAQTIERYALQAAGHLVAQNIKMLVVACNTATAFALPLLQARLEVPVIGVIGPGASAAVAVSRGTIGVIATEGTVRAGAYRKAIHDIDSSIEVIEQACPLFVALAEEGWANTHVAREVAEIYLTPLVDAGIDTLVLGCTHYPLLRSTIRHVAGDGITIVDSAETTARAVAAELTVQKAIASNGAGARRFQITDASERFSRIAAEFLESPMQEVELVSLG